MNGNGARKIEVFEPFNQALELTKRILFQPFDFAKWLVIGFAAFLSHLAGSGGGGNYNFGRGLPWNHNNMNWNYRSWSSDAVQGYQSSDMAGCWIPLIIGGVIAGLLLLVLFLWVGSRGKFIFTDCVVRNRAAIAAPWHEFRREGNSLFLFHLVVTLALIAVVGLATIPFWLPLLLHGNVPQSPAFIVLIIALACLLFVAAVFISTATSFMVPLMYRRRCGALGAFRVAIEMIMQEPGPVILYVLFVIVLWLGFAMISCLTSCITCCLTALPYVGTVILLPGYVFLTAYVLLFVRQFGPEYDAWASLPAVPAETPAAPLIEPPAPPSSDPPPPPPQPPIQT